MGAVLVDAYSQIFRGFYAISNLSDSRGEPTNAIFAFAKLLLQLDKHYPSRFGAMAFDCGKVAFRLAIAPDYKGNREPTPELLLRQIPVIRRLASAFGWPLVEAEDFEADDLIAGASAMLGDEEVSIVSSDKDLAQLVSPRVSLLRPAKPSGFSVWRADEVVNGFGVRPDQIVDYLALLGDSSDNIPGVRSVGSKTAAKILAEVDSLAAFFSEPSRLSSEKLRSLLLANAELIDKNRRLISLRAELPEALMPEENWLRSAPDWEKIRDICSDLELRSILKELPKREEKRPVDLFDF